MRPFILFALTFLSSAVHSSAQSRPVNHLVFEGAGIRGIAYTGVVRAFEEYGIVDSLQSVAGTSAGALTAMMLSLGYKSDEIENIITSTSFARFNDGAFSVGGGLARLSKHFGWYHTDRLDHFIGGIIERKTKDPDLTFGQWQQRGFTDLYVTGTSINNQKLLVFSRFTYPDMKVRDAVRISMSIPLYFEAAMIDDHGKICEHPADTTITDIVVDGGILANFPVFIFDETTMDAFGNRERIPDPSVLGVRIDDDRQIELDRGDKGLVPMEVKDFPGFMEAFYVLVLEQLNREQLRHYDWERTVSISSVGIGPKIKNLTPEEVLRLTNSGYTHTANRLEEMGHRKKG